MLKNYLKRFSKNERRLFLVGLVLKLLLGATLASDFLLDLFAPFVAFFVNSGFENAYAQFVASGQSNAFPYPAAMLYILTIPQLLIPVGVDAAHPLALLLFRLPLFVADLTIFVVLSSWLSRKSMKALIYLYWLSPVLVYINYVHGQLDSIPIALLFVAMFLLFRDRLAAAGIFAGLAIAAKTNVVLIYPLILLFLSAGRRDFLSYIKVFAASVGTFVLVNLAYLDDPAFREMVFDNTEQAKFFLSSLRFGETSFYIVPAGWFLLMILGAAAGLHNRDVLITFAGFAFGVVLLLIPPQNGWYYWILPFLAYFFAREQRLAAGQFWGLQIAYLVYFLVLPSSDYLQVFQPLLEASPALGPFYSWMEGVGIDAALVRNLSFTILQCMLFLCCFTIFRSGVFRYRRQKLTGKPFLVGIGGNSGAGKSTHSQALKKLFTDRNVVVLTGDDQHRWQRGDKMWQQFTHLDPKANHLHNEIKSLQRLLNGQTVSRARYDHETGRFTKEISQKPARLTLLEGLHPFFLKEQRDLFDLRIFIAPEEELALHWKLCRDSKLRGHSLERIREQIELRRDDYESYIAKQSAFADIVIHCLPVEPIQRIGDASEQPKIHYELDLGNSFHLEPALELIESVPGITVEHEYSGVDRQTVRLSGDVTEEKLAELHHHFDRRLQEIGVFRPQWPSTLFGIVVFLVVFCIYEKADHARY